MMNNNKGCIVSSSNINWSFKLMLWFNTFKGVICNFPLSSFCHIIIIFFSFVDNKHILMDRRKSYGCEIFTKVILQLFVMRNCNCPSYVFALRIVTSHGKIIRLKSNTYWYIFERLNYINNSINKNSIKMLTVSETILIILKIISVQ